MMTKYDEDLAMVLGMLEECELAHVSVKGCAFYPGEAKDGDLVVMLAHHHETRAQIECLRDFLIDCLERSTPAREAA